MIIYLETFPGESVQFLLETMGRISFKMEQILSYFTQDIIDLILKKNAEIQQENIPGYPKLFHESL